MWFRIALEAVRRMRAPVKRRAELAWRVVTSMVSKRQTRALLAGEIQPGGLPHAINFKNTAGEAFDDPRLGQ